MGKAKRLKAMRRKVRDRYPHHSADSRRRIYRSMKLRDELRRQGRWPTRQTQTQQTRPQED